MVLQRNKPILFWGFNSPETIVKIKFAEQEREVKTNEKGRWEVSFPARNIGSPLTLSVSDKDEVVQVSDILMGEVWLCSGQSNMEWKLRQALGGEDEVKAANNPLIRHIEVPKTLSFNPNIDFESKGWKMAKPENAGNFTAVGYYFAKKLQQDLQVPIGLIHSSWGGTPVSYTHLTLPTNREV